MDGSDAENISTPSVGLFTLNVDSRKLYWITSSGSPKTLNYSELDGSGHASHTYPACCVLTVEAFGDDVFFGAGGLLKKGIWRADPDGSNEQFLRSMGQPEDLAYDPVENKLYIARGIAISRMNLDGTGFEDLVVPPPDFSPERIVVDSWGRKVYWADSVAKVIRRSYLDGSNVEDFVTASDVGNPDFNIQGLTIVPPAPIPALSGWALLAMAGMLLGIGLLVLRNRLNAGFSRSAALSMPSVVGLPGLCWCNWATC